MSTTELQARLKAEQSATNPRLVVLQTLRKHWGTALFTALVVLLGVTLYTLSSKKIYQTVATIEFDPHPPRPLGSKGDAPVVELGVDSYLSNQEYYETQYKVIMSARVSEEVVATLGLANDVGFLKNLPPGETGPASTVPVDVAAQILDSRLKVDPVKNSRLATLKLEDADPQRAQRILTAIVDTYLAQNIDDALASTNSVVDWLQTQLDKLKDHLEESEMALHEYKHDKNILSVAFDDQSNMLRDEMRQINGELTHVRTQREQVAARVAELAKVHATNPTELPASEFIQSSALQSLRQRYDDAVRERDGMLGSGKGEKHPDVLASARRLDATRDALFMEVANIRGALTRDLAVLQRQEGGLSGLFERAKKQALDLNLLEIEYNRLQRTKANNEKLYSMVLERTKESDLTRMLRLNNIRLLDRPTLPRVAIHPRTIVNLLIGALIGVVLGVGAALARALMDRSVKTPDDVENELGIAFLGLIPETNDKTMLSSYMRKRRRQPAAAAGGGGPELVVHEHPGSAIAEAARAVRTNLIFMTPDNPYRTMLVTSAGPAEGKTTVACCIAIAMAQAGQSVVLVDCDLRRPRLHRIFGKRSDVGLTTTMLDEVPDLGEIVQETAIPNLSLVCAGPLPPSPAELLLSSKFKDVLAELSRRFDRVILDSPPILPVTDGTILSTLVDGTVLIVRAFSTKKEVGRYVVKALRDVGAKTAGAVLNAVNLDRHEYKYSYSYYRRQDYDYHPRSEPSADAAPPPAS